MRRRELWAALLVLPMAAAALISCGRPSGEEEQILRVALVLSQSADTHPGDARALEGLQAVENLGARAELRDQVSDGQIEAVLRELAAEGIELIIGHGMAYAAPAERVAQDFPDSLLVVTDAEVFAENLVSIFPQTEQNHYLAGLLAGKISQSNRVGFIGSERVPRLQRAGSGFLAGARAANPGIEVRVSWVGSAGNPVRARTLAQAMIAEGVDVIVAQAGGGDPAVIAAAAEAGIWVIRSDRGCREDDPGPCLASVETRWDAAILRVYELFMAGGLPGAVYTWGLAEKVIGLGALDPGLPEAIVAEIELAQTQILDGSLPIPLLDLP